MGHEGVQIDSSGVYAACENARRGPHHSNLLKTQHEGLALHGAIWRAHINPQFATKRVLIMSG
eukprot:6160434-Pyramimonas_sp.AAC.1